jgi:IS1 family transposase
MKIICPMVVFSMWRWTEIAVIRGLLLIGLSSKEDSMTLISVRCPHCHSDQSIKRGKTGCGTQRYLCQHTTCATGSVLLDYRYPGRLPEVKHQSIAMSLNASGVRDTARGLRISTDTVLRALKQREAALASVNTDYWGAYTRHLAPDAHCPGKHNTQTIERKPLTLRTRIKRLLRKTICFSKSTQMHDIVIGLFVNRYAFGLLV